MVKPVAAVFCDDVRLEMSGKLMFIGIYTGSMLVRQFPWTGRICPVVLFDSPLSEMCTLRYRIGTADGAIYGSAEFELEMEDGVEDHPAILPLPPASVSVSGPEVVQLWLAMGEDDEELVGHLNIRRGDRPVEPSAAD